MSVHRWLRDAQIMVAGGGFPELLRQLEILSAFARLTSYPPEAQQEQQCKSNYG